MKEMSCDKKLFKIFMIMAVVFGTVWFVCSCAGSRQIAVFDGSLSMEVPCRSRQKVSDVLSQAGVALGPKDRVLPSYESVITADIASIKVLRYAQVNINYGASSYEVNVLGGTVSDALHAAGIQLTDADQISVSPDTFLTDGLTIDIATPRRVTIEKNTDGIITLVSTAGTVGEFLKEQGVALSGDYLLIPGADTALTDDLHVRFLDQDSLNELRKNDPKHNGWHLKDSLTPVFLLEGAEVNSAETSGLIIDEEGAAAGNIAQRTQAYIRALYNEVAKEGMSVETVMEAAFNYIGDKDNLPYKMKVPYYSGENWPYVYMNDLFSKGQGDCHALSALFGYFARYCGYKDVALCSNGKHAWAQIDGEVYDPVFNDWDEFIFGLSYAQAGKKNYLATYVDFSDENSWRYIRLEPEEEDRASVYGISDKLLLAGETSVKIDEGWVLKNRFDVRYYENGKMVTDREVDGVTLNEDGVPVSSGRDYNIAFVKSVYNLVTTDDMSREEKLERGYYYFGDKSNLPYKQTVPTHDESDWPNYYMSEMLENEESDCHALAAFFGLYAKMCGYEEVYWCCTGEKNGTHGWTEIDGLIYDPVVIDWPELVYGDTLEATQGRAFLPNYGDFGNNESWRRIKVPETG